MIDRRTRPIHIGAITTRIDELLCRVVAPLAQALKGAQPEFVDIAVMWLDGDRRSSPA
jgi:hypothetical protein